MGSDPSYFSAKDWSEVEREEFSHVFEEPYELHQRPAHLAGLAISGGGIRSASFALGVLQGLVRHPKKDEQEQHEAPADRLGYFQYMSTVSGGGYIGSALTWFLSSTKFGTAASVFPFGTAIPGHQQGGGKANAILDYMRQHGNYLIPGKGLNAGSVAAVLVRTIAASLFIYGGLLIGLMSLGLVADSWIRSSMLAEVEWLAFARAPNVYNPLGAAALFALLCYLFVALLMTVVNGIGTWLGFPSSSYGVRTGSQRVAGAVVSFAVLMGLGALVPIVTNLIENELIVAGSAAGSLSLGTILSVLGSFISPGEDSKRPKWVMTVVGYLAAALVIFGLFVGCYAIAHALQVEAGTMSRPSGVSLGLAGAALIVGGLININYLTLHRMYRDRLMETFMPDLSTVEAGKWAPAKGADKFQIADACKAGRGPYHLVSSNVVLINSPQPKYRSRGGDSFVMSRLFCGSEATGWRRSKTWKVSLASGMTLASAMAISGAAANPNTGLAGAGLMRSRVLSALMSVLNIRLGYWAPNPKRDSGRRNPNYLSPGIGALLGQGLDEDHAMVELSDGGHFENMALYELIRRRADLIVCCDGGADAKWDFGDFSNAIERLRVDFGVRIEFEDDERALLLPRDVPAEDKIDLDNTIKLSKQGYVRLKIRYPADEERNLGETQGTLFFLKTTMIAGLPGDLYSYKSAHPDFPDQTTADQFFDEKQFEAHRELGYHICHQMLRSKEWNQTETELRTKRGLAALASPDTEDEAGVMNAAS